jgi:hypothetical protein
VRDGFSTSDFGDAGVDLGHDASLPKLGGDQVKGSIVWEGFNDIEQFLSGHAV